MISSPFFGLLPPRWKTQLGKQIESQKIPDVDHSSFEGEDRESSLCSKSSSSQTQELELESSEISSEWMVTGH